MTPIAKLYFSAFIIISLELVLMVYIFMLQPKLRSNQLFAAYMLMLSISSYSILVASTAFDITSIYAASRTHTLATMIAGPLLWLVVFHVFIPQFRLTQWVTPPLLVMAAIPLVVGVVDWLTASQLFFEFKPELYENGFLSVSEVLNGRLSNVFYTIYIPLTNTLLVVPFLLFAFTRLLPDRLRHAARVLLVLSLGVSLLYLPWLNIQPALRNMLTPVLAAVGAAWVVGSYHFFSPLELAMKQVVDTVAIGLLVFDEQLILVDANAFSVQLLPIRLLEDKHTLPLSALLQRILPKVENQTDLVQFQAAVQLKPEETYQQEIVLQNGRFGEDAAKTWILFNVHPVYDSNNLYQGLSCSIEDLTVERRTQAYITETHKALEQYAYNQALLNDITQAAISALDFDATLSILASRLAGLFEADNCYISLWDEDEQKPKPAVAYGVNMEAYLSLDIDTDEPSISRELCRLGQVIAIEDVRNSPYVSPRVVEMFPTRGMLGLPMVADRQIVGALLIGFNKPRMFSPEDVKWGEQIARQLTLAIFKNRLLESEHEQRVLAVALQAAGQALTSTLDFNMVMDRILDEIARVVPYDTANFSLVNKGVARFARTRGFEQHNQVPASEVAKIALKISETPTLRKLYETKRPLRIANTANSPDWIHMDAAAHIKSWLGVPLVLADEVIAFLSVDKVEADFYQNRHEEWLMAFASQAALALQHAQLFTEIQRRVTELEALSMVSTALRSSETIPVILQTVLEAMVNVLSARVGVAFLLNEEQTAVTSQASYPASFYPMGIQYALGEGITGHVAQTGQVYIAAEVNSDPKSILMPEEPDEIQQLHSTIALPLISEEGIQGVIHLGLDTVYEFAEDEIRTLKAMSNIVANGLQRIQVMQTLEARVASRTYDLESANERLQELDKLKTKFIADVSHELRTPVANLSLYVNLLQHGKPEKQPHYLAVLQQQANRLTNLVEATLGLSRLEVGPHNLEFGPVMLNEIVSEIVQGHQARADAFDLQLSHALQSDLPPVFGNKTQLAQLTTNLVTNAINYNRTDGQIFVETFVQENEEIVCLKVVDNGVGISEAELPHLFDRFYRGQRTGQSNIPGTGLGLAIVKEIVDLHRGEIEVSSQLNEGSTFLVRLPVFQLQEPLAEPVISSYPMTDDRPAEM